MIDLNNTLENMLENKLDLTQVDSVDLIGIIGKTLFSSFDLPVLGLSFVIFTFWDRVNLLIVYEVVLLFLVEESG